LGSITGIDRQPASRSSPSAAPSASTSVAAIWCTRDGDSPAALARGRIETPWARAEASAHRRSRSACSSRHAARETLTSIRRWRRLSSIRPLIVARPECQQRSGNWTPERCSRVPSYRHHELRALFEHLARDPSPPSALGAIQDWGLLTNGLAPSLVTRKDQPDQLAKHQAEPHRPGLSFEAGPSRLGSA
jgi:hypothetical protein